MPAIGFDSRPSLLYGVVYIVVPAFILLLLGFAINIKTWKMMTGCRKRHYEAVRGYGAGCSTLMEIFMQALVAPSTWVSIALLDGKYYACAMTVNPYSTSCEVVVKSSPGNIKYTVEYTRNKQKSQILGWIFIAVVLLIGSLAFMMYRWSSNLTYYHRRYRNWYREIEKEQFEETAKKLLTKKAKENIRKFLESNRNKEEWDKISTVFTFKRRKDGSALYSRLDEWNDENPELDSIDGNVDLDPQLDKEEDYTERIEANKMVLETLSPNKDAQKQTCHSSQNSSKENPTETTTGSACDDNNSVCALVVNEQT